MAWAQRLQGEGEYAYLPPLPLGPSGGPLARETRSLVLSVDNATQTRLQTARNLPGYIPANG